MKGEKDILKQMAAQQDSWDESPAPELWGRLEARLDAGAPGGEPSGRRIGPFVIVTIALILISGISGIYLINRPANKLESTQLRSLVKPPVYQTESGNRGMVPDQVETGQNTESPSVQSSAPTASLDRTNENPDRVASANVTVEPVADPQNGNATAAIIDSLPYMIPPGNYAPYNYNTSLIPQGDFVVTNGYGNPVDTVGSLQQYRNGLGQPAERGVNVFDNRMMQLNMARNDISLSPRGGNHSLDNLHNFEHINWILGSWKTNGPSGASFEEWKQVDAYTVEGRGFFVVNGDTVITEKMRIEQRGENVYYIVAIDTNQKPMKFRLKSQKPQELIFENPENSFPQEIIIQNRRKNNLKTIMQNPVEGAETPTIDDSTILNNQFNNPRNTRFDDQQLIRSMKRSADPEPPDRR